MDNVNKIISFILGLIVVVVFIAIVTGKFHIGKGSKVLTKSNTTPTVTPFFNKKTPTSTPKVIVIYQNKPTNGGYNSTKGKTIVVIPTAVPVRPSPTKYLTYNSTTQMNADNLSNIPNTGAPTLLIPTAFSMLAGGIFLRKAAKKK